MKKIIISIIGLIITLPLIANAASFVATSNNTSYKVGDNIILNISVNPESSTVYTAMFDSTFTIDTLEVVSFSLNDNMLPLKQPGYDAQDNTNGVLTKTGGYAGGINSNTNFGILTLRAKKEGIGNFTIADNSKLLDANGSDLQSGNKTISFEIKVKPVTTTYGITPKKPVATTTLATTTPEITVPLLTKTNVILFAIMLVLVLLFGYLVGVKFGRK